MEAHLVGSKKMCGVSETAAECGADMIWWSMRMCEHGMQNLTSKVACQNSRNFEPGPGLLLWGRKVKLEAVAG